MRRWVIGRATADVSKGRSALIFRRKQSKLSVSFFLGWWTLKTSTLRHLAKPVTAHPTTQCRPMSHSVAECRTVSHSVTQCHTVSHIVAQCRTVSHSVAHCRTVSHSVAQCRTVSHIVAQCRTVSHIVAQCRTVSHSVAQCRKVSYFKTHSFTFCYTTSWTNCAVCCSSSLLRTVQTVQKHQTFTDTMRRKSINVR